ncbi:MAG: pantetheine-phosphate adenylyltransferase [Clostridia bacterium]|nr:pantetheine-phosphate adenylyltransferase [Clostridia bacterium]
MHIGVFAGTFDPFTVGHLDVVKRAAPHFDRLIVTVCVNPGKGDAMFSLEERKALIVDAVKGIENVEVTMFGGVLIEYCRSVGASSLVRSIRSGSDVDYERMLESVNLRLDPGIETFFLLSKPELAHISSSLVRQLIGLGIAIDDLVPNAENAIIKNKIAIISEGDK